MSTSAARCPDCNEPTPTGGWVDASGRTHHVGCGDPLGQKAAAARIAELEAALKPFGDAYRFTQQLSAFMRQQYQVSMTCTGKCTVADLHRAAELTK